ncbi:MAG TPA: hypothetical protein VIR64_06030 [Pseudobacillus sp.]
MTIKIGSKYACPACSSEFIVTKTGNAHMMCCGKQLEEKRPQMNK